VATKRENRGMGGAADWRGQEAGGGGVGNGTEGPFYRRTLVVKMGDGGCLHVGVQRALCRAHTRARCSGAGVGKTGSGWRQCEGDAELHGLSLPPVQEGEVVRCRAEEATRQRCSRQRWRGADACVRALSGHWCPSGAGWDSLAKATMR
jgi:hypothetical protein